MEPSSITCDPVGEALHVLRMSGAYYSRCEFTAPWGLKLPELPDSMMFHVVMGGECWLDVEGTDPRVLRPGDLALVPHGEGHRLMSAPGTSTRALFSVPAEQVSERYEILRQGGGGESTTLICGTVNFDHPAARRLVTVLPRIIVVEPDASVQAGWRQSALRFMTEEAQTLRPGGEAIITRLADVLVIQAIRAWLERDEANVGWIGALRDEQIGRALALMHGDLARDWTIASLAHEVAMSRSAFAARFTALVGEPPLRYVTRWRLQMAMDWLRNDGLTIGELAARLGYRSEAAFSRAFKRCVGVAPGAIRRSGGWRPSGDEPGRSRAESRIASGQAAVAAARFTASASRHRY